MTGAGATPTPTPNYADPVTHGPAFNIAASILLAVTIIIVGLRLWARLVILKNPGWDDIFVVLALVIHCACFGLNYEMVNRWYWDRHTIDVPVSAFPVSFKLFIVEHDLAVGYLMFCKLSILTFFFRVISRAHYKVVYYLIIATIICLVGYSLVDFFWYNFNCSPTQASWLLYYPPWAETHTFRCGSIPAVAITTAIFNCAMDYWIAILPLCFIPSLNLHKSQKLALFFVFAIGFVACAASTVRVWLTHVLITDRTADVFWAGYTIILWAEVEADAAIIVACAPALRIYVTRLGTSFRSGSRFLYYFSPSDPRRGPRPAEQNSTDFSNDFSNLSKNKSVLCTVAAGDHGSSERNLVELTQIPGDSPSTSEKDEVILSSWEVRTAATKTGAVDGHQHDGDGLV